MERLQVILGDTALAAHLVSEPRHKLDHIGAVVIRLGVVKTYTRGEDSMGSRFLLADP